MFIKRHPFRIISSSRIAQKNFKCLILSSLSICQSVKKGLTYQYISSAMTNQWFMPNSNGMPFVYKHSTLRFSANETLSYRYLCHSRHSQSTVRSDDVDDGNGIWRAEKKERRKYVRLHFKVIGKFACGIIIKRTFNMQNFQITL